MTEREAAAMRQLFDAIDRRIDMQLTPETLTRLAMKGITPQAAREHLRTRALQALQAREDD